MKYEEVDELTNRACLAAKIKSRIDLATQQHALWKEMKGTDISMANLRVPNGARFPPGCQTCLEQRIELIKYCVDEWQTELLKAQADLNQF